MICLKPSRSSAITESADSRAAKKELNRIEREISRLDDRVKKLQTRMGEIADIVQAVLYLDSASFVTGEILHVDGGQSAGH